MQERSAQWVDDTDWIYEADFLYDGAVDAPIYMKFGGLDTVAEVRLNGQLLGRTENMFIPHEFRIDQYLKSGTGADCANAISVTFRSAKLLGLKRQIEWNSGTDPITPHWDTWSARSFVRKAQYMYGWDWGPVLLSCGIWREVEIYQAPRARLLDWSYSFDLVDGIAELTIVNDVERSDEQPNTPLAIRISLGGESITATIPVGAGLHKVETKISLKNPEWWQPNGLTANGQAPTLYDLKVEIVNEAGEVLHDWSSSIGLRTIELLHEPDPDGKGEGFQFRINGNGIFAKGANWIPNDSFPSLTTTATLSSLRQRVTQARDAGFNMLRVWGGGLYESEEFYSLCDELGLLVWQDFAYGCAYYPDKGDYAEMARVEATAAVRRIRNHPSLALWCGNNENHTMYFSDWGSLSPSRHVGEEIYHKILPEVVAKENPDVPYWPSSPFGGDDPACEGFGDCHNWDVWHGRGDWTNYTENDSRFCSEFGFASSCSLAAWKTVLTPEDRTPRSQVVRWHDKTRKGYETYLGYIDIHYPELETLEDLVYYSQINQADALKYGVEHYRRRMGRCWGTLFWQLNDCWPVQSWAVIDSLGQPKAAYYAAKRFYAPLLLSLKRNGDTAEVYVVSDLLEALSGTVAVTIETVCGEKLDSYDIEITAMPGQSSMIAEVPLAKSVGRETETIVHARFTDESGEIAENILLLAEPKELAPPQAAPSITVSKASAGTTIITVTASQFSPYVWISRTDEEPLELSDNFFHLRAGESRCVEVAGANDVDIHRLHGLLSVRSIRAIS